jgi:hypothetical protein
MNKRGHPATLRAAQPGNGNAVKSGIYSRRVRTERAEGIRAAATGTSTLALARAAVVDEFARLGRVREALDEDIAARGPSTRKGAARGQVSQPSIVSKQLEKLKDTWAMGEPMDGDDIVDGASEDGPVGSLREELLALLVLRDLLDHDLEHRGVSTPKGGKRDQVALRVRASRDLVRLVDRIRTEARRAVRSGVAPMSRWDVAREIAFDTSQHPSAVIGAVKHLLPIARPSSSRRNLDGGRRRCAGCLKRRSTPGSSYSTPPRTSVGPPPRPAPTTRTRNPSRPKRPAPT